MSPGPPPRVEPAGRPGRLVPLRKAALLLSFWSAVGIVFALPALSTLAPSQLPVRHSLAAWWSWGLLAPGIAAITRRLPFDEKANWRRLLAHVLIGRTAAVLALYLSTLLSAVLGVGAWSRVIDPGLLADALRSGFVWELVVYGLIAGVAEAALNQRRYLLAALGMERLERSYADARLHTLRMQLDPHFLFDALNTISAEVTRDGRLARAMIEHLATLLRASLDEASRHEVRLADELAMLEHYLAIQRLRLGERLSVRFDVPEAAGDAIVPSLLIQPLVENAIRHGIAPRLCGGTVQIVARRSGSHLLVTIGDDGVGLPRGWSDGRDDGVGLANTRERIARVHGGGGRLAIRPRSGGGTELALSLPFRVAGGSEADA